MYTKKLSDLSPSQSGVIAEIITEGLMRRRLQDIGFVKGTKVDCLFRSPLGDPTAYGIKGTVIALRYEVASKILIE